MGKPMQEIDIMKPFLAALSVLALALTLGLATPAAAQDTGQPHYHGKQLAHDTGTLHFHGEQLTHDTGELHFHDEQLANKNLCFHNCLEQNGATAKKSCAMQCGLAGGGYGKPKRDCGTEFKNCKNACGKDKDCKKACRAARKQCY